ncbi:MAG TPA: peptidyl-tRNA hydrolase Pth2 [Candidatus Nanoarchaeia archaeon]|nr:peptidyl-tRNA hydrolase Pth2 [Candidatus Nanoarchaeia archaeon]
MALKQVILVRKDLKLPSGKLAAQVAHASLEAALKTNKSIMDAWRNSGAGKIVLKVADEAELKEFEKRIKAEKIPCVLITDAGHTVLEPGTVTALGIGPVEETKIDKITGNLKMY